MIIFRRFLYRFGTIIINVVKINYCGGGSVDRSFDRTAKREIRPVWGIESFSLPLRRERLTSDVINYRVIPRFQLR